MAKVTLIKTALFLTALAAFNSSLFAEEKKKEKELPKSGVLSTTIQSTSAEEEVPMPWGAEVVQAEPAPIAGSVSRTGPKEWTMRLFNNSEDTYSVSVKVLQKNLSGSNVKTDHFSHTLSPGGSAERKMSGASNAVNAVLELVSWKNLSKKKNENSGN